MPVMESAAELAAVAAKPARSRSASNPVSPRKSFLSYLRDAYSLDLRSLALFRIGLALVLIGDLLMRSFDLTAFYTDWGVLPRAALLEKFSPADRFSIHLISGQPVFQVALFLLAGVFALMLLVGVKTRFAALASWFMVLSLQNRNPEILQGGDVYLRLLAFWAIFLPIGAMYSIDCALDTADAAKKRAVRFSYFSGPGLALLLQIAFVYMFSVALKTGTAWHSERSAVYYALNIQQMSLPAGRFLLHFPKLLPLLTRLTLLHEAAIPVLILLPFFFGPARTLGILLIFALHFALGITIRLGHFPWIAATAALPLLPTWFWERVVAHWPLLGEGGMGLRLYYDQECPFCRKAVHILRVFLLLPAAELTPAQASPQSLKEMRERNSWIVVEPAGTRHCNWDGLTCLLSYSPIFRAMAPIGSAHPIKRIGDRCYSYIRARRETLTDLSLWLRFRPLRVHTPWIVSVFACIVTLYVFLWNLTSVTHKGFKPSWEKPGLTLGLDQEWNMFSPFPLTYDGWYVIEGHLRDGSSVNVLDPEKPVTFAQPLSIADQYKNERWRKYLMNLSLPENSGYRLYYGRYFCRSWNTGRAPHDPWALINFDIYFMAHQNSISHPPTGFSPDLLWHHECFK
jgi:predicted DCC family thiol-disulfide oxidoreductase YuxK